MAKKKKNHHKVIVIPESDIFPKHKHAHTFAALFYLVLSYIKKRRMTTFGF